VRVFQERTEKRFVREGRYRLGVAGTLERVSDWGRPKVGADFPRIRCAGKNNQTSIADRHCSIEGKGEKGEGRRKRKREGGDGNAIGGGTRAGSRRQSERVTPPQLQSGRRRGKTGGKLSCMLLTHWSRPITRQGDYVYMKHCTHKKIATATGTCHCLMREA